MEIKSPSQLNLPESINFCNDLDLIQDAEEYIFDWNNLNFVEPFGMLLVGAKIRQFIQKHNTSKFYDRNYTSNSYAANMGFFKSVYQDYGKNPGELNEKLYYIPIKYLRVVDLERQSYQKGERTHAYGRAAAPSES